MAKGGGFQDFSDDLLREASSLSDQELERLMAGGSPGGKASSVDRLEPGARVSGTVVDFRGGEILVELDGKTLGVLNESEFAGGDLPAIGERIQAQFERLDPGKDLAILSVGGVRKEVFWDEIRPGAVLEGIVTAVNKGGLTLDVKGSRAFLPVSQIERERVEDLAPYLGRKLRVQVTAADRSTQNLVVSRRAILEVEAEAERVNVLARLGEGEVLKGTVVRITDHGAFVNLGGADGLIPASKIHAHVKSRSLAEPLRPGQQVEVQVVRIDRDRGRISLDLRQMEAQSWGRAIEGYAAGDEVTGWVSRRTGREAILSIDEGIEGVIPEEFLHLLDPSAHAGAIVKAVIVAIDPTLRRITLRPAPGPGSRKADAP